MCVFYCFYSIFSCSLEPYTVEYSQSSLIHLVGPSDCTLLGFVHGGNQFNNTFMIITLSYFYSNGFK